MTTTNFVYVPRTDDEYRQLVHLLDELTDIVRSDEDHPLANFMDVLSVVIENYKKEHI